MSRNDAAIPFYFTPAAQAELARARTQADSVHWHDRDVDCLIQMAVRHGWKYDLESGAHGNTENAPRSFAAGQRRP